MQLRLRDFARWYTFFIDVGSHVLHVTELIAHGFAGFLLVRCAVISSLCIEVSHSGPSALAGTEFSRDISRFLQVHVAENDVRVAAELPHNFIPCGGLLSSSSSSSAGDKSDEHGLAAVNGRLDLIIDVRRGKLLAEVPMVIRINC